MVADKGLCLHIGCGLTAPEVWFNVDASPSFRIRRIPIVGKFLTKLFHAPEWPQGVHYGDIIKGIHIPKDSCDLIFASHVLEHLSLADFHTAMNHIYSYLKPGGIFRAIVPDLESCVKIYNNELSTRGKEAAHDLVRNLNLGASESRRDLGRRLREIVGNSRHQWMWDTQSLFAAFQEHGFIKVRRSFYGDWTDQRFQLVEGKERYVQSLGMEGIKPAH